MVKRQKSRLNIILKNKKAISRNIVIMLQGLAIVICLSACSDSVVRMRSSDVGHSLFGESQEMEESMEIQTPIETQQPEQNLNSSMEDSVEMDSLNEFEMTTEMMEQEASGQDTEQFAEENVSAQWLENETPAEKYAERPWNDRSGVEINDEVVDELEADATVTDIGDEISDSWGGIGYSGRVGYWLQIYLLDQSVRNDEIQQAVPNEAEDRNVESGAGSGTASYKTGEKLSTGNAESILNTVSLNPQTTGFEPLDTLVSQTLSRIISEDMSNYEKAKACYDYLINNCSYGYNQTAYDIIEKLFNDGVLEEGLEYVDVLYAYGMLLGKVGMCNDYSAACAVMMRAVGFDCHTQSGQIALAGGEGYTGHIWCEAELNGVTYVFDPQIDDNTAKGGTIGYYRFCKMYEEVPEKYIVEY